MPVSASALSDHVQKMQQKLREFMESYVYRNEKILSEHQSSQDCWNPHPLMEEMKVIFVFAYCNLEFLMTCEVFQP